MHIHQLSVCIAHFNFILIKCIYCCQNNMNKAKESLARGFHVLKNVVSYQIQFQFIHPSPPICVFNTCTHTQPM